MGYDITKKDKGGIIHFIGNAMSVKEIDNAKNELYCDAEFDSYKYLVLNFTDACFSTLTEQRLDESAAIDAAEARSVPGITIIIVVKEPHAADLFQYYAEKSKVFASTWKFIIADSMRDAEKRLNALGECCDRL